MKYWFEKKIIPDKAGFDYICWGKLEDGKFVYAAKHLNETETELDKQEMIASCNNKIKQYKSIK